MCGIAGTINHKGKPVERGFLEAASDILRHRGPDGKGEYISRRGNAGFIHRRLAIIDLNMGHQPIFNEDRDLMIIFNGEIYNYKELKGELLELGHVFTTMTDTEVVLHAFEEWGSNCLPKLNGMFCFVIWSEKEQKLIMARDRLGVKIVYYYSDDERFIFSSEIKAILLHKDVKSGLNEHTLIDFMTFQNTVDEKTFFNGVHKLLPAHYMVVKDGKTSVHKYWEPEFNYVIYPKIEDYVEEFKSIFKRSVHRHLISDVPLGTYLSGGFDSTSVATMASQILNRSIPTFTGAFAEGKEYDERLCAKALCKGIKGEYHDTVITASQYLENISKVIYHLDEPTLGSGAFPQYMVAKLVSQRVKVVLTGHAGDEFFGGYPVFKAAYLKDEFVKSPFQTAIKWPSYFSLSEIPRGWYFLFGHILFPEVKHGLFNMFSRQQQKSLFTNDFWERNRDYVPEENLTSKYISDKKLNCYEKVFTLYLKTYLPTLFVQEDKVSMAHSVEARTPICDNEMLDFALKTPLNVKIHDGKLKYLVKTAMKDFLPPTLYHQKKKGFPTPFAKWFKNELNQFASSTLLSKTMADRGVFSTDYLCRLLNVHNLMPTENIFSYARANKIYSLLLTELWFQTFLDAHV